MNGNRKTSPQTTAQEVQVSLKFLDIEMKGCLYIRWFEFLIAF